MSPEVLSVSSGRNRVEIRSGPYDIIFVKGPKGKAIKVGFTFYSSRMESSYIPPWFFNPAARIANSIFHADGQTRKKEAKNRQLDLF